MKHATIIIKPDDEDEKAIICSGDVKTTELIDCLKLLTVGLCEIVVQNAKQELGTDDEEELIKYINFIKDNNLG